MEFDFFFCATASKSQDGLHPQSFARNISQFHSQKHCRQDSGERKKAREDARGNGAERGTSNYKERSYMEMEKRFKMFVYKEGELPLVHNGPCKNIYTTEGRFIHEIQLGNRFLTSDPEKAHVFFLPFSVVMMVSYVYKPNTYDTTPLKRFVSDYISLVSNKYPFWNRSLGADHFFLSCHDWAPETSKVNPYLFNKAIRVLCNANTSEGFNPAKDASLPEVNFRTGAANGMMGGNSALRRPLLAFFAGGNHGPIRPLLLKHWKNDNDSSSSSDIRVYEYLPKELAPYYNEMMKKSKYCLCPSGYEVASPRIVEAIYSECVPVIISDDYVLPFSDVLNWNAFSLFLPSTEIPNLRTILDSIPLTRYVEMQQRLKQVRTHFELNQPPKPYDMFHMILHSIWLRRLNVHLTPHD
ncbi:probable glycosyltransferase At5g03795 isoform X1 [Cryptomeria japonica]|uniref:probable glycosyltransferase At5g03795 isoform X1 n=1 Tax=Cryptomeria japonica TaxID=3369 RepID=UPI0027DAA459|nr:probable glycosyltransferase At5g03795 isoform X1 [Cryptomeria japonica]